MSNPIRIAQGPPTEEGLYLWRPAEGTQWIPIRVTESLWGYSELEPLALKDWNTRGQWSTRIPDPEEME